MTTLTTANFTDEEKAAIEARLTFHDDDVDGLTAYNANQDQLFNAVIPFDVANQKIQDASIAELITILHGIVTTRDTNEPLEAPHIIKFGANFPAGALPDLDAATVLATYLLAVPSYATPVSTASLLNGASTWELYHTPTPPGPPEVVDPNQPTVGELTPAEPILRQEFDERNVERLDATMGSFVLKSLILNEIGINTTLLMLLDARKDFWEGVGFSGS